MAIIGMGSAVIGRCIKPFVPIVVMNVRFLLGRLEISRSIAATVLKKWVAEKKEDLLV